ncbi:MAG: Transporter associated domain [Verrucomicrobiota bacterium]
MSIIVTEILIVVALFVGHDDPAETLWHKIVECGHSTYPVRGEQLHDEPHEGASFTAEGLRFEVIDMDRTSVEKVLISREPHLEETTQP